MKKVVNTNSAPMPVGPYSQAVIAGDMIYCSGQLGIDPKKNSLVSDNVSDQAEQSLKNLKCVLEMAGSSLDSVVKTTIFLTDMDDFKVVNEVYASFFKSDPPARSAIGVAELPKGAKVEIELIATIG